MEIKHKLSGWLLALCLAPLAAAAGPTLADTGAVKHQHATTASPQKPWGIGADRAATTRTVEVTMTDTMRFAPDRVEVSQGEVVKFVLRNGGKLPHEMVIGTERELKEHASTMASMPDMGHVDANAVRVEPAGAGELVWKFNRPGSFRFACLVPGHFEAGMTGTIVVTPARPGKAKS
jgi:uncharacterized cupredoxin-like copper-binding protein